ncbi:NAD-dependent epimerase/dehydratase family protein [Erwinia rhapontici]|uniref:NAD-dependent epimerase/dehydratase family protein n=1 Tax=Erwinia rhapontici TaxID=55212 RepID=UPI003BA3B38E
MKILLTGARGMVGKNVLEHKRASDFEFYTPTREELNLLDASAIEKYFSEHNIDFIIHAAGVVGGIQANIKNPVKFLVDNMLMGVNLITESRKSNIFSLLNLGSSCMYPRGLDISLSEDMILKGELEPTNEGYALAKVAAARLCEYIVRESPEFSYKTAIPCNLYGKHDKFSADSSHMIPAVISKLAIAKNNGDISIDIWGDGEARREFMYAEDLADFIFYAIDNFSKMPQNLNVGLGHDYSINEYYKEIAKVVGYSGSFEHDLSRPVGMRRKLVDNTLLAEFGWRSKTDLNTGIVKTYKFFLEEVGK